MSRCQLSVARARTVSPDLNLTTGGTFARTSAAWYQTSASAIASASSGTRRAAVDRGDGLGIGYLAEKSATNLILRSRDKANAAWTKSGTPTYDATGPDGSAVADEISTSTSQFGFYQGPFTVAAGEYWALSAWVRSPAGTTNYGFAGVNGAVSVDVMAAEGTADTTWRHVRASGVAVAGGFGTSLYTMFGVGNAFGSLVAYSSAARDALYDLCQLEAGPYPTSPIDTAGASVTRPQDTLSYASGAYPAGFLTSGVVIIFAPDASSAEIISANEDWRLVQVATKDYVRIRKNGAGCDIDLVSNNTIVATRTVTFSRGAALTITAKPSAGSLTVSGATTGDGTATGSGAAWQSGQTLYIGGDNTGANPATGRFLDARGIGLVPCIQVAP